MIAVSRRCSPSASRSWRVHDHEIGPVEHVAWHLPRRRGVEREVRRLPGGRRDDVQRDLELREHRVRALDVHVFRAQARVRAGRDDDLVLAVGRHEDERHAGARVDRPDRGGIDAGGLHRREGVAPEVIVPDGADERHVGAEPRGRHRLVRALAARHGLEVGVRQRLARPRQPLARARRGRG